MQLRLPPGEASNNRAVPQQLLAVLIGLGGPLCTNGWRPRKGAPLIMCLPSRVAAFWRGARSTLTATVLPAHRVVLEPAPLGPKWAHRHARRATGPPRATRAGRAACLCAGRRRDTGRRAAAGKMRIAANPGRGRREIRLSAGRPRADYLRLRDRIRGARAVLTSCGHGHASMRRLRMLDRR